MRYSISVKCIYISKEGRGVPNGGKFPSTRLITCRSSKEHRHLHSVGECEGSKYVCTVLTGKIRCSFEERCYQPSVRKHPTIRKHPPLPYLGYCLLAGDTVGRTVPESPA